MEKYSIELLNKLGKMQYYTFLRYALGVQSFLRESNETFIAENVQSGKKYFRIIGQRVGIESKTLFFVEKGDYSQKIFWAENINSGKMKISAYDYFDDLNKDLLKIILVAIYGLQRLGKEDKKDIITNPYVGINILSSHKLKKYNFILGAGVNLDRDLKITLGNWNSLIDAMRERVRILKGMTTPRIITDPEISPKKFPCTIKICDELIKLEESICNTNYIAPEILKDLDENEYYEVLYKNLYASFTPSQLVEKNNPQLANTNIFQIARIIQEQGEGRILTFNYDNVLETVLDNNFNDCKYQTIYYGNKEDTLNNIYIIHSHGFYPYTPKGKPYPKGIVLSTYEYLDGYFSSDRYARKKLTEQVKETNILIGNSVSDYEEQKVFFTNFKKNPSSWHYLFLKKSDATLSWEDEYKVCYFIKMGIIPVFFNDFSDIVKYLENIKIR